MNLISLSKKVGTCQRDMKSSGIINMPGLSAVLRLPTELMATIFSAPRSFMACMFALWFILWGGTEAFPCLWRKTDLPSVLYRTTPYVVLICRTFQEENMSEFISEDPPMNVTAGVS